MALLVFNCQKEEITEQSSKTEDFISNRTSKFSMLKTKEIENDKNLMRIIKDADIKKQESRANKTVYNAQYDFTINTNYAKVIANELGTHNYTFGVYREEDNGLLENLLLKEQTDGTFEVYLVQYDITTQERNTLANQEIVDVENKITYVPLEDISSSVFDKVNSTAETCTVFSYEWEQGSTCNAGGNHTYNEGSECSEWGNPDLMATSGGYVLTSQEVDCGSGTSTGYDPGNTDDSNTNSNNTSGGYGNNGGANTEPDTTPILCTDCPEVEFEEEDCEVDNQDMADLESVFGAGNITTKCSTNADDVPSELHFNTIEELQAFVDQFNEIKNNTIPEITLTENTENPSLVTTTFEFVGWPYVVYTIEVNQQLGNDFQYFTDYSVVSATSSISGVTFMKNWVQTHWHPTIDGYESTVILKGNLNVTLFYNGVGRLWTEHSTFTLKTNATDGSFLGQSWD
jgi:hypothetical protein